MHNSLPFWTAVCVQHSENVSVCDISRLKRAIALAASKFKECQSVEVSNTWRSDKVSIAELSQMPFCPLDNRETILLS
jgi:hypothetical protein